MHYLHFYIQNANHQKQQLEKIELGYKLTNPNFLTRREKVLFFDSKHVVLPTLAFSRTLLRFVN